MKMFLVDNGEVDQELYFNEESAKKVEGDPESIGVVVDDFNSDNLEDLKNDVKDNMQARARDIHTSEEVEEDEFITIEVGEDKTVRQIESDGVRRAEDMSLEETVVTKEVVTENHNEIYK